MTSRAAPNDEPEDHAVQEANHETEGMAPPAAPTQQNRRGRKRKQPVIDEEPATPIDPITAQVKLKYNHDHRFVTNSSH